ncbi:MAG: hypothetical protein M3345_02855 [Actinomycetota bacterium]|nr:hypothetical protein [Actinomycetota bacterium]
MAVRRAFEREWPSIARRLSVLLAGRGIPPGDREDIVQETGLRLLCMWDRVDLARGPLPLATTIALNLVRDAARRPCQEVPGTVPERASFDDVERSGIARVELASVARSLAHMSAGHRAALLAELNGDVRPRPHKMVRFRARRALKQMLDRRALGAGVGLMRLRRVWETVESVATVRAAVGAGVTSVAMATLLGPFSPLVPEAVAGPIDRVGTAAPIGTDSAGDRGTGAHARAASWRIANATNTGEPRSARLRTPQARPANGGPDGTAESDPGPALPLPPTEQPPIPDVPTVPDPGVPLPTLPLPDIPTPPLPDAESVLSEAEEVGEIAAALP